MMTHVTPRQQWYSSMCATSWRIAHRRGLKCTNEASYVSIQWIGKKSLIWKKECRTSIVSTQSWPHYNCDILQCPTGSNHVQINHRSGKDWVLFYIVVKIWYLSMVFTRLHALLFAVPFIRRDFLTCQNQLDVDLNHRIYLSLEQVTLY